MNNTNTALHKPVLLKQSMEALEVTKGKWYIDGTFGRGGHTQAILNLGGNVIAFDVDQEAIEYGQINFTKYLSEQRLILVRENFNKLTELKQWFDQRPISGIIFDFGTSVDQLKDGQRGFSFDSDCELDMRMDTRLGVKAKDLLAILPENQLAQLFWTEGGENKSKQIAREICRVRKSQPISTTAQLVAVVNKVKRERTGKLHPATKVFQALRIATNMEMQNIREALPQALELLQTEGRIVTISFHEGEDRIVKQTFRQWEEQQRGKVLTPKPITPSQEEQHTNPRSRSAKLRIFIKKS